VPPLLLVDLDDTLVDRSATFHRWLDHHTRWPHHAFWVRVNRHLQLHRAVSRFAALLERHEPCCYRLEDGVAEALRKARQHGWRIAVVTNGNRRTQLAKIRAARFAPLVDAVCISSHEGVAKPDPRIFRLAAARAGAGLEDAWVIGGDLSQEIAGARELGLPSVWVTKNHPFPHRVGDVGLRAETFPQAVELMLSRTSGDVPDPPVPRTSPPAMPEQVDPVGRDRPT